MRKAVSVSAPGKLMLFGEHAVVYGRPCIVTAVSQRMHVTAERISDDEFMLDAPDVKVQGYRKTYAELGAGEVPRAAAFVECALSNLRKEHSFGGVHIRTASEFTSQFGFGSSSASTVGMLKAVSELFDLGLSSHDIFDLAYRTVLDVQGKGSGFDVAAATFGGTLAFVAAGKRIDPIDASGMPLLVGYTGTKADTVSVMAGVSERAKRDPKKIESLYTAMGVIEGEAEAALRAKDWKQLGACMNRNQEELERLGVSGEMLDRMIHAARGAGAYGAKLSGAGVGDCMIALVPPEKSGAVRQALADAGGQPVDVFSSAPGVRVE